MPKEQSVGWPESFFIQNAKLYSMVLQSMWKNGEEHAKLLANMLNERGLKNCSILDIPCGIGRISIPLAKLRFSVTGVDISPYFVNVAKKKSRKFRVANKTSFTVGGMKEVDSLFRNKKFDVAINVSGSLGYGTDEDDMIFFRNLRKVVRTDGLFIISGLANRDYLFSHFVGNLYEETDKLVVLQKNELDISRSRIKSEWRFYLKHKESLKFAAKGRVDLRLYSPHELTRSLETAGWKASAIYDSLVYKRPYSANSPIMLIEANNKG